MATVLLSAAGSAFGGPLGAGIGRFAGAVVDRLAVGALTPARQVGARLSGLQLAGTAEGAPVPAAFGRARVGGQVIWAARFKERRVERQTGGGKGGPKSFSYSYSLSFAVAVAEGPIDGIGRVWADGAAMDMTGAVMRTYLGGSDQTPDPLIEAVEGSAPAYRGTAYVVFEDLPLDAYGNRPPQLNFEVFRRPAGVGALEDRLKSVCLIPGAGEFVLATRTVLRRDGLTVSTPENMNNPGGRPDLLVSLDQLQAQLPHLEEVSLVVGWFGDDLRAGSCRVRPGVDQASKSTVPLTWSVSGVDRAGAHVVSRHGGGAAYGGTPTDAAVLQAIAELKARGLRVTLYPFLLMDLEPGNGRPDPYGGAEQAAYPWRGRITGAVAPGRPGTCDGTPAAGAEVAAFFGRARAGDFAVNGGAVAFTGADDGGYRRMALHYAHLAVLAGGVDGFLVGSELRGLTTLRSSPGVYPAVEALRALAVDCRGVLGPAVAVGYGADWSEWFGHQPADGSGEVRFHLDPLWADPAVSFVGVDFYPPLADWRAGEGGADAAAGHAGPHDPAYLLANVAGGEDHDWFYASAADRAAQKRTPITDGAYGEPWVFRPKDLLSWWSNAHHDRPGGVRSAAPTAWTPRSKPIRLTEFGCPAVDRGANSPNLFLDPKSAESALPPDSTGGRDDLAQRRALEAVLAHYDDPANNPVSPVYGGSMLAGAAAWCWDARPYPDFPARADVWADAPDWARGHWLNGRLGGVALADLAAALAARAGVGPDLFDPSRASGRVAGYVAPGPASVADALEPLAAAYPFDAAEGGGIARLLDRDAPAALVLAADALAPDERTGSALSDARTLAPTPDLVRVRWVDAANDYQTGSVAVRAAAPGGAGPRTLDLQVVGEDDLPRAAAARLLDRTLAEQDALTVGVGPLEALRLEPGDVVEVENRSGRWRVLRVDLDEAPRLTLARAEPTGAPLSAASAASEVRASAPARTAGPPAFLMLDLPPLEGFEDDPRPLAAVSAQPWTPCDVSAGPSAAALSVRGTAAAPAVVGTTLSDLPAGPLHRWDRATRLRVAFEGGAPPSLGEAAVLNGAAVLAVRTPAGAWEVLQFARAEADGPGSWVLSDLLRGQCGTDGDRADPTPAGAPVVLLTADLARAEVGASERTLSLTWRAAPAGGPPGGIASSELDFAWNGVAFRPWSPAHLAATRTADGSTLISWTRRARLHGDAWDGPDPPLGEEAEAYRVEIARGGVLLRTMEVSGPAALYTAADRAADRGGAGPVLATVRVAQLSAIWGWGVATQRELWL